MRLVFEGLFEVQWCWGFFFHTVQHVVRPEALGNVNCGFVILFKFSIFTRVVTIIAHLNIHMVDAILV